MDETYVFNGRNYRVATAGDGWVVITGRPGETPVCQTFADEDAARTAWSRMLAATIANRPQPLRSARINTTLLVLVADHDGRAHMGELDGPGGDAALAFTDRAAAVTAWRNRCCELAHAADPGGTSSTVEDESEME